MEYQTQATIWFLYKYGSYEHFYEKNKDQVAVCVYRPFLQKIGLELNDKTKMVEPNEKIPRKKRTKIQ